MCWISGVVPFNTWPISSWVENTSCYKLRKCTKWHIFHSKWSNLSFWVKIAVILSVVQLVTTFIFFSAWDRSRIKWDNSQNSTQKMRTFTLYVETLTQTKGCFPGQNWNGCFATTQHLSNFWLWTKVFVKICKITKANLTIKVQIFWEGHKKLAHLPLFIWHYLVASNCKWKMG